MNQNIDFLFNILEDNFNPTSIMQGKDSGIPLNNNKQNNPNQGRFIIESAPMNPSQIQTNFGQSPYGLQQYQNSNDTLEKSSSELLINGNSPQFNKSSIANNTIFSTNYPQGNHNPVVNPVPFNMQNPYILKQLKKFSSNAPNSQDLSTNNNRKYFGNMASVNLLK